MRKKALCAALAAAMLPTFGVWAQTGEKEIRVSYNDIKLYINEERVTLTDPNGAIVEPFIYEGTTYLPLRSVAESLDKNVDWDGEKNLVSLTDGAEKKEISKKEYTPEIAEKTITVTYRNIAVSLNGETLTLKTADQKPAEPFIYEGTTYLPLRAVAEATSAEVDWDGETKSIYLTAGAEEPVKEVSDYDLSAGSDWTAERAESYGYVLDLDAQPGFVKLAEYHGTEKNVLIPSKIDGKTVYVEGGKDAEESKLFWGNETIESVSFEEGVKAGWLTNILRNCPKLKAVYNLPHSTQGAAAFYSCKELSYVDGDFSGFISVSSMFGNCLKMKMVPSVGMDVTSIASVYVNCKELSGDIYCEAPSVTSVKNAFQGTEKPILFHVPYPSVTYDSLMAEEIPENVTIVPEESWYAYLPKEINVASYTTLELYNKNIMPKAEEYEFQWDCEAGTASQTKYTIEGTEEKAGAYPLTLTVSKDGTVVFTVSSTVNIVSTKNLNKGLSVVTIGDGYALRKEWKTRIGRYNERARLVGTRSGSHEGRYGAKTNYYLSQFDYKSDTTGISNENPFFNPATERFDWNFYKQYSGLSVGNAQLMFEKAPNLSVYNAVQDYRTMTDAVHEADANAKVFICLPFNVPTWSESNRLRNLAFVQALSAEFEDEENVYLIPLYLTYNDDLYDPRSKANPNEDGFNQIGDCIYGTYMEAIQ